MKKRYRYNTDLNNRLEFFSEVLHCWAKYALDVYWLQKEGCKEVSYNRTWAELTLDFLIEHWLEDIPQKFPITNRGLRSE